MYVLTLIYSRSYLLLFLAPTLPDDVTPIGGATMSPPSATQPPAGFPAPSNSPFMQINFMGPSGKIQESLNEPYSNVQICILLHILILF